MEKLYSVRPLPILSLLLPYVDHYTYSITSCLGRSFILSPQSTCSPKVLHRIQTINKSLTIHRTPLHRESTAETHLLGKAKKNIPFYEAYVRYARIPHSDHSYPDHAIPPTNGPSCPLTAIIPSIEASPVEIDIPDIQRALIRRIRGQKARAACPDSMTFSKIESWPSGIALHGGQESAMVEEQCGISRPFRDVVKKTLVGPFMISVFSTVWRTQWLVPVCRTTLLDNQLSVSLIFTLNELV